MGRHLLRAMVAAVLVTVLGATAAGANPPGLRGAARPVPVSTPAARIALPGTALPQVRHSAVVGRPSAAQPVTAVVFLRPRNGWLLHQVASRSSGRPGLSRALLHRLFLPADSDVAAVERYVQAQGLEVVSRDLLSLTVRGPVAAQERAFGVTLGLYRGADGRVFRAPSGPARVPRAIASVVQGVGGLDTALRLHPAMSGGTPNAVTPSCNGAKNADGPHTLLPAELGNGYNHNSLIDSSPTAFDGTNEVIGLVEFTNYKASDIGTFKSCFPALSGSPPVQPIPIGGGTSDTSGAAEAELDIEVAQAAAPAAHVRAYVSPNNIAEIIPMISRMMSDNVTIVSDSWGLCEPVLPPSFVREENSSLELAAAAGISFYVASGDDGSSGCKRITGSNALFTDDPSSQPFATSVGGTTLDISPRSEKAWKFGGGGISMWWPKPSYQVGKTISNNGSKCDYPASVQCREAPDIALNANPNTGYIIFCTAGTIKCGGATGWFPIGGTSGAAPLLAGITADANESSLANGGGRLGFANPFLYANNTTAGFFHDITAGNNNIAGGTSYQAGPGYDMATGLGSPDAAVLATHLAGFSQPPLNRDNVTLSTSTTTSNKQINYGTTITFSGTLTDTTTPANAAHVPVYLQTGVGIFRVMTNASGTFALPLKRALVRNLTWHAEFVGNDHMKPAISSPSRHLYIRPHLGSAVALPRSGTTYIAKVGKFFTFWGVSSPNMHGARVIAQFRFGGPWHSLVAARVGAHGKYTVRIRDDRRETFLLRWIFQGGTSHHWLSAVSKARRVKVT